jgi:hypothetical protein
VVPVWRASAACWSGPIAMMFRAGSGVVNVRRGNAAESAHHRTEGRTTVAHQPDERDADVGQPLQVVV